MQLLGSTGSGKSALCETLTLYMRRKGHDVVYVDYPIESPEMLRAVLAQKFDLPSINNISRQLEDALESNFEKPKLIIFDDAQSFSVITLIEIQRLAEIQVGSQRMLNVLLCGDVELEGRLSSKKQLQSLLLHVTRKYLLPPMDRETVAQFFSDYVTRKGCSGLQLSAEALDLFYKSTKGYPGSVVQVSELIIQDSAGKNDHRALSKLELSALIDSSDIKQIMPAADSFNVNQLKVVGPVAAVFVVAVLGFIYQQVDERNESQQVAQTSDSDPQAIASPFAESAVQLADNGGTAVSLVNEESNQELPTDNANSQAAKPFAPSILRPAPVFSLDDEEPLEAENDVIEEPVSDSALALVTAAELGVTPEVLVNDSFPAPVINVSEPELEAIESVASEPDLTALESSSMPAADEIVAVVDSDSNIQSGVEELAEQGIASVTDSAVQASSETSPNNGDGGELEYESAINDIVLTEEDSEQDSMPDEEGGDNQPEVVVSNEANVRDQAAVAPQNNVQGTDVSSGNNNNADDVASDQPPAASAELAETDAASDAERVKQRVDSWVKAWEQQALEAYFASYGEEFEPRYESSVSRWRASRTRVIGNAEWIRLNLSEYEIIEQSADSFEVHFWLDYESPTYSDSTKKKLVLGKASGGWMIEEEINLEVRS